MGKRARICQLTLETPAKYRKHNQGSAVSSVCPPLVVKQTNTLQQKAGKVHSNMVYFDTPTRKKLTITLLDTESVHSEEEILETAALQKAKGVNLYVSLLHAEPATKSRRT